MHPKTARHYKTSQTNKKQAWPMSINGKGTIFVPMRAMSYQEVVRYIKGRFPGYKVEVAL